MSRSATFDETTSVFETPYIYNFNKQILFFISYNQ